MILALLSLWGCAHVHGVASRREQVTPAAGTEKYGPIDVTTIRVSAEWDTVLESARLSVETEGERRGSRDVEVVSVEKHSYRSYDPFRDAIGKVLINYPVTLVRLLFLQPPTRTSHDHDGDGAIDAMDRLRDTAAFLNPLEAGPSGAPDGEKDVTVVHPSRAEEIRQREPVSQVVHVAVADADGHDVVLYTSTDESGDGVVDLAEAFTALAGEPVTVRAWVDGHEPDAATRRFDTLEVADALRRRYGGFQDIPFSAERRQRVLEAYREAVLSALRDADIARASDLLYAWRMTDPAAPASLDALGATIPVSLVTAVRAGWVRVAARGAGIERVDVEITNELSLDLDIEIEEGTVFTSTGGSQNMVVTARRAVRLEPSVSLDFDVEVACANRTRPIPHGGDTFTVEMGASGDALTRLAPHLRGAAFPVRQAAVWIVTDDASRSDLSILQRGHAPVITDADVLEAIRLLELAGIDWSAKDIAAWVRARH